MRTKNETNRIKINNAFRSNGCLQPNDRAVLRIHSRSDFNVYFLSDLHCGAVECNYDFLAQAIRTISKDRHSLVVIGGDTIEAIPRGYKINEDGQHCPVDEQIAKTIRYLRPIAKQIVVMFKGNHNLKSRGETVDTDFIIAEGLGVPYKTVPSMILIKTSKGIIRLAGGHGKLCNKDQDAELRRVREIFPHASVYFLGHTHALFAKPVGALVYTDDGVEKWDPAWFVRTGNFLNYAEYARYSFMPPQRSGFVQMSIKNGKVITGTIITDEDIQHGTFKKQELLKAA